jgi:hypothetical protein
LKDPDKCVALTDEEKKALQDEVCPEWDDNLGEPPHHYFLQMARQG